MYIRPDLLNKKNFRRYLFYRHNLKTGSRLSKENIICLRSNDKNLLSLNNYLKIKNKILKKDVKKLQKISFIDLK